MPKLRVHNFTISLDGYAAGPDQTLENPMGVGTRDLHQWYFRTQYGRAMMGQPAGEPGNADDERFVAAGDENVGATIMGRNMFGPVRGEWPDDEWRGWWGPEPPYHHEVFVLTHHARDSFAAGETTFHFVTDGIRAAYDRAVEAAGGADVRIGGGASTVQQYLEAGLVDEMHLAIAPIVVGGGERLFADRLKVPDGFEVVEVVQGTITHVRMAQA